MKEMSSGTKEIGERIARERIKKGWSQQILANQANTSRQTIHGIEAGKHEIKSETMVAIAKALEVPLSCLQPEELDAFNFVPNDCITLIRKLRELPTDRRHDVLKVLGGVINNMVG